jgi:UDP-N-acetylmuramate--alanine ligase
LDGLKLSHDRIRNVHLLGIGGSGMSGLAALLSELGFEVSGCDMAHSYYMEKLLARRVDCVLGHDPAHLDRYSPDLLVYSSAIPDHNEELIEAGRRGISIARRAEVLSALFNERFGVGIAGTHGKTTTSSMTALILDRAGLKPTVAIGGEICDIGANARLGAGLPMVAELDESDGSFELFRTNVSVVTNVDWDHVDHYKSRQEVEWAFIRFLKNRKKDSSVVICGEDPGAARLIELNRASGGAALYTTYGWGAGWDWGAFDVNHIPGGGVSFSVLHHGKPKGSITLKVSGDHNVLNALAACAASSCMNVPFETASDALKAFKGAKRRLQYMGSVGEIDLYDDYGHHPREVAATLRAVHSVFPGRRIVTLFQPHRFTRTAALYREFAEVLAQADRLFLVPIYGADETPIPGVCSDLIARTMTEKGAHQVTLCNDLAEAVERIGAEARRDDLVLTLGAGNVNAACEQLMSRLEQQEPVANAMACSA